MKNQALFSLKDKSKTLKCLLLQFLFGALRVKEEILHETVEAVNNTNATSHNAKTYSKCSNGHNSIKNYLTFIKQPHAYLHNAPNMCTKFEINPLKTVGGVDYTNSVHVVPHSCPK